MENTPLNSQVNPSSSLPVNNPKKPIIFIVLGVVVLAILVFIGFKYLGGKGSIQEKRTNVLPIENIEKTELNWMGHWMTEDKREDLIREIAKEFETINPNIDVNLKFHIELFGTWSKEKEADFIVDQIKTGEITQDIVWLDTDSYGMVAKRLNDAKWGEKYLVNFMDVHGFKETHKSFITEDPSYRDQTGGIVVGPYLEGYYIFAWYNEDLAKKIGITIKQEGMTFEDFLGYVKAVDDYNIKNGTNIGAIYEAKDWISTSNFLLQSLFKSEIGNFNLVKVDIGSVEKNVALLKSLKAMEQLGKYKPLIKNWRDNVWFDTRNLVLEDKALFHLNGVWMYNHWNSIDMKNNTKLLSKMVPAELPTFKKTDYYIGGYIPTFGVMKDSPNKDAAIKLLMFMSKPQVAEKWTRYTKAPTAIKGSLSTGTEGNDVYEKFQATLTKKYGANLHDTANAGYILGEANKLLQTFIDTKIIELLEGKTTAEKAYSEIMIKVKK